MVAASTATRNTSCHFQSARQRRSSPPPLYTHPRFDGSGKDNLRPRQSGVEARVVQTLQHTLDRTRVSPGNLHGWTFLYCCVDLFSRALNLLLKLFPEFCKKLQMYGSMSVADGFKVDGILSANAESCFSIGCMEVSSPTGHRAIASTISAAGDGTRRR